MVIHSPVFRTKQVNRLILIFSHGFALIPTDKYFIIAHHMGQRFALGLYSPGAMGNRTLFNDCYIHLIQALSHGAWRIKTAGGPHAMKQRR